jgi:glutamyl-tRNA reductase
MPESESPWTVTQVPAQLDAMAGACNELHRANRRIMFIVPISNPHDITESERATSCVAIFTLPKTDSQ